jgi:tetratricopeptide (TPR) repeat protein
MSYLILDTDKQSTHSLRLLLSAISTVPVWDAVNVDAFAGFSKKHPVPAEILLLDLDGDPAKLKAFEEHLMPGRSPSSALITLGSNSNPTSLLKADHYLQKPVHIENLKRALVDAQARTQEYRSTLILYGNRIPTELSREVGRSEKLWKQILEIQSLPQLAEDRKELAHIGALFLNPTQIQDEDLHALAKLKKITSASRISLICLSNQAEEIGKLRNVCDYYISPQNNWRSFLDQLAKTRLMRLGSSLNIDEVKIYLKDGKTRQAQRVLKETIKAAPLKTEAILLSGECDFINNRFDQARLKYQNALKVNPCLPKPYARLLQIEKGSARETVLKNARAFCPGVAEFRV